MRTRALEHTNIAISAAIKEVLITDLNIVDGKWIRVS
jgi:hypothetical protein